MRAPLERSACCKRCITIAIRSLLALLVLGPRRAQAPQRRPRLLRRDTTTRRSTAPGFALIIFFPLFVFLMSMLQKHLEKRKEARKAAHKASLANGQWRGGW